jgi:hypothetical protein
MSEIDVWRLIGNSANKGILITASPNPKVARISAPAKTTRTTRAIIVTVIIEDPFLVVLLNS